MERIRLDRFLPTRGGLALAVIGLGIFGAAQTTGAGWLTVLASLIVGTLMVGIIWPIILIRSISVELSGPDDVVVDRPFPLSVRLDRPEVGLRLEIAELTAASVWVQPPSAGTINVTSTKRGVLEYLTVNISCTAPFDIFSARRRIRVALPDSIFVAPQPIPMQLPDRLLGGSGGDGVGAGGVGPGEMVRSLREYVPGDAMRMVHWRASARRDHLLVKELEPPERPHLAVIVDVSGADGDHAAGEAAGLIQAARHRGHPVTLLTVERAGRVVGDVGSVREAGRRLAGAMPGEPPNGPIPDGAQIIRLGQTVEALT